ncbi:MAG: phage antirepressor KilAC domain-containing protein [Cellvibrionaceae bacterium]
MQQVNLTDTASAAKILNIKHHRLLKTLRDSGVFHKEGKMKNTPLSAHIESGHFMISMGTFSKRGIDSFYSKALVTPLGLSFLQELISGLEEGPRPDDGTAKRVVHGKRERPQDKQAANEQRNEVLSMVATIQARPRIAGRV